MSVSELTFQEKLQWGDEHSVGRADVTTPLLTRIGQSTPNIRLRLISLTATHEQA
jgi:3-deoxy-D-manno-octulosonic-acid transferase